MLSDNMLEIKNIIKQFSRGKEVFVALDNISFVVEEGEYIVINGPSGAGKSTLLYSVAGMIVPDSGGVFYRGDNIYEQRSGYLNQFRRNELGFMFQQFHLMPYLNIYENIRLVCADNCHYDLIEYYLEKCSLMKLKNKYPSELSVGEKQRTAFIRAIMHDPAILLADEPTGNLDQANGKMLMSLVEDYHMKGGTVIVVSHDPLMAKYADRNLTLNSGRLT